jgi:D-3-phosphoglycerate dehydrogenase
VAVAELAMGLICAIDRKIPDNVIDFRNGKWNKALYSKAEGLFGKTIGVVGTGRIGIEIIKRAKAFGLNIIAWSRSLTDEKAEELEIERVSSLEELFGSSDIVSIHLAQTSETKKIISKELINKLKKGAYFINTARAGVVDEAALVEAVKNSNIFLGLDVFSDEPEGKESELSTAFSTLPNVYLTHHIGASTEQAQNAVAAEACNIIADYVSVGVIRNWVNRIKQSPAKYQLVVRHYDKPGVLARVLRLLSEEKINAQEMENVIFDDAITACCKIKLDSQPTEKTIKEIESLKEEIINVTLIEL